MPKITLSDDDLQALLKALEDARLEHLAMDMEYGGGVESSLEQADEAQRLYDLLQVYGKKPAPVPELTGIMVTLTITDRDRVITILQPIVPVATPMFYTVDPSLIVTLEAHPVYSTPTQEEAQ